MLHSLKEQKTHDSTSVAMRSGEEKRNSPFNLQSLTKELQFLEEQRQQQPDQDGAADVSRYTLSSEDSAKLFAAFEKLNDDLKRCGIPHSHSNVNPKLAAEFFLNDWEIWVPTAKQFKNSAAFLSDKDFQDKLKNVRDHLQALSNVCRSTMKDPHKKTQVPGDYWKNLFLILGRHKDVIEYTQAIERRVNMSHEDYRRMDAALKHYRAMYLQKATPQDAVYDDYLEEKGASRIAVECATEVLEQWEKTIMIGRSPQFPLMKGCREALLKSLDDNPDDQVFPYDNIKKTHPFASCILQSMYWSFQKQQKSKDFDRKDTDARDARTQALFGKEDIPAVPYVKIPWKRNIRTGQYNTDAGEFCMTHSPPVLNNPMPYRGIIQHEDRVVAEAFRERDMDMKHFMSDKIDSISKSVLFGEHLEAVQKACEEIARKFPTKDQGYTKSGCVYINVNTTPKDEVQIIVNAALYLKEVIRLLLNNENRYLWGMSDIQIFAFIAFRSAGQLASPLFNAFVNFNTEYRIGPHTQRVQLKCYERSDEKQVLNSLKEYQAVAKELERKYSFTDRKSLVSYLSRMDTTLFIFEQALRHVMRLSRAFTLLDAIVTPICLPVYLRVGWLQQSLVHGKEEAMRIIMTWKAQIADARTSTDFDIAPFNLRKASIPYSKKGTHVFDKCGYDMRQLVAYMCNQLINACDRDQRSGKEDATKFVELVHTLFMEHFFPKAEEHINVSLKQLQGKDVVVNGVTSKTESPKLYLHSGKDDGSAGSMTVEAEKLMEAMLQSDMQEFYRIVGHKMYHRFYDDVLPVLFATTTATDVLHHSRVHVDYLPPYMPLYEKDEKGFGSVTLEEKHAIDRRRVKDPFIDIKRVVSFESVAAFDLQYARHAIRDQWLAKKYNTSIHFFADLRPYAMNVIKPQQQKERIFHRSKSTKSKFRKEEDNNTNSIEIVVESLDNDKPSNSVDVDIQPTRFQDIRFTKQARNIPRHRDKFQGRSDIDNWRVPHSEPQRALGGAKKRW